MIINRLKSIFQLQLIRFALVGSLGSITNLVLFFIFVDLLKFNSIAISIVVFFIAATQNYIFNHLWTFRNFSILNDISITGWIKFIITSLSGLVVNLIVLFVILRIFPNIIYKFIAQGVGILAGMGINYLGSRVFVFK